MVGPAVYAMLSPISRTEQHMPHLGSLGRYITYLQHCPAGRKPKERTKYRRKHSYKGFTSRPLHKEWLSLYKSGGEWDVIIHKIWASLQSVYVWHHSRFVGQERSRSRNCTRLGYSQSWKCGSRDDGIISSYSSNRRTADKTCRFAHPPYSAQILTGVERPHCAPLNAPFILLQVQTLAMKLF